MSAQPPTESSSRSFSGRQLEGGRRIRSGHDVGTLKPRDRVTLATGIMAQPDGDEATAQAP
eukprot:4758477-Prymnesium_polylepis.1